MLINSVRGGKAGARTVGGGRDGTVISYGYRFDSQHGSVPPGNHVVYRRRDKMCLSIGTLPAFRFQGKIASV